MEKETPRELNRGENERERDEKEMRQRGKRKRQPKSGWFLVDAEHGVMLIWGAPSASAFMRSTQLCKPCCIAPAAEDRQIPATLSCLIFIPLEPFPLRSVIRNSLNLRS